MKDMKICSNCGAESGNDSRFCTECGQPFSQNSVCPHCGAAINEGDAFCQSCGKSLNKNASSVQITYEKEQPKSGFKKYLPYIVGIVVLLAIIGYFNSRDSNSNNDSIASDSLVVDSTAVNETTPISKEKMESILTQLIGDMDANLAFRKANQLFTEEFKTYYNRACEKADREGCERPRLWWQFSDCDPKTFIVDKVEMAVDGKAKAFVELSSELYKGRFEVLLKNENGDWFIDKITELEVEYAQTVEETDDNNEENLDWLQGHWVYEQGNYKGHFIIQGDKIIQYSSMNPERDEATFRIEGDELRAKLTDGMDLVVKIDFGCHSIDYGDGCWMHKVE